MTSNEDAYRQTHARWHGCPSGAPNQLSPAHPWRPEDDPSSGASLTNWTPYGLLKREHDGKFSGENNESLAREPTQNGPEHGQADRYQPTYRTAPPLRENTGPPHLPGATQYLQRRESQNGARPSQDPFNAPTSAMVQAHNNKRKGSAQSSGRLSATSELTTKTTNNQPPRTSKTSSKRPVQTSGPLRGTQYAPLEISSSPEPETKRRKTSNSPEIARPQQQEPPQLEGSMHYHDLRQGLPKMLTKSTNVKPSKVRYYAVAIGREIGVYPDWSSAEKQVHGFFGAKHKKFKTVDEALAFIEKERCISAKSRTVQASRPTPQTSFDSGYHLNGTSPKKALVDQSPSQRTTPLDLDQDFVVLEETNTDTVTNSARPPETRYYAVAFGRQPGVYNDGWLARQQCEGLPDAIMNTFKTEEQALAFIDNIRETENLIPSPGDANDTTCYAVALGCEPGMYVTKSMAEKQADDFSGPKARAFKCEQEAWEWIHKVRRYSKVHPWESEEERPASSLCMCEEHSRSSPTHQLPVDLRNGPRMTSSRDSKHGTLPQVDANPDPVLVPEQQQVVDLILQGHNVFYTGSAGCGKSTILKAFVKQLTKKGRRVKIIAPTNLAALNVGGQTTWNFAGWTPDSMKKKLEDLLKGAQGKEVFKRLTSVDVLVIDEISMIENLQFERLNLLMKQARGNGAFGGVQIIVTGDFCQLSPVKPFQHCIGCGWELQKDDERNPREYRCEKKDCREDVFYNVDKWAFRSKAWRECNFKHVNLTQIHRQSDMMFKSILNRIRTDGRILPPHARVLLNHTSETEGAIELYALRRDVDRINNENIAKLRSVPRIYKCADHFRWADDHQNDRTMERNTFRMPDGTLAALKEHRFEPQVQLKQGQRVVLQANVDPSGGLVNGAQGTIIDFEPFDKDRLPKASNGKTDDGDLRGDHATYREHQIKDFAKTNGHQPWPVVEFLNGRVVTIMADCTVNELGNEKPYSLLSRTQIPLAAGYAITVHKSQGMTLDRVTVDLGRAFETSQIYVALSRARSLKGLTVKALPRNELGGANPQVAEFMQTYLGVKAWSKAAQVLEQ